jgi:cytochrome b
MKTLIWDLPTRLFHWLLAALVAFSWWSHEDHLDWHRISGIGIAGLLVFRLWWGVAGSSTARFTSFLKGPRGVIAYLKGGAAGAPGHNPLGGWSVAAMLLALIAQVGLGLFSVDEDGFESGPLAKYVSFDTGRAAAGAHEIVFTILLGLIVLHLLAIGWYAARKQNLVGPMITGHGAIAEGAEAPMMAPVWRLLIGLLLGGATFGGLLWLEKTGSAF